MIDATVELGAPLPNWKLAPLTNEKIPDLKTYLGKPLLIVIFNLGCPGCLGRALPFANRMVVEKGENISVLGIHSSFEGIPLSDQKLISAKEEFFIRFPYFRDQNEMSSFKLFQAGGTPHWLLVDQFGNLAYSIFGSDPNNALLRLDLKISELLEE